MECKPTCVVWFLLLCLLFAYHQFSYCNAQETIVRSCTSPCSQCNFNYVCEPPPPATCIRENIALGKNASMSTEFTVKTRENTALAACLTFDGYRDTHYVASTSYISPDCIHTYANTEEWVQVDLGRNYTITNITVYRRDNGDNDESIQRLKNILITVDNQQCYQFPADVATFPTENKVRCITPLTGRIVKLSTRNQYINLCEIEIWVCKSGRYGEWCDGVCHCRNNAICDNYYGTCLSGCDVGYYGFNCSLQCGQCSDQSQCNASGHCLMGCQLGWQEPNCDYCKNSFYGADCNKTCGFCNLSRACNKDNGTCLDGCADGYEPPHCKENCSSGMWGRNCVNACGACLGFACRHDNGVCENGCFSGYEGEHCTVLLQQTNDRYLTGVIAGSVVGAGLLIGGSIVTAVLIWLRRSTSKDRRCHQTKSKGKETQETSNDNNATENLNFPENVYDKFESREDVSKPYTMLQKDNHDDCGKHSTTLDSSYENYATQRQNTPDDS